MAARRCRYRDMKEPDTSEAPGLHDVLLLNEDRLMTHDPEELENSEYLDDYAENVSSIGDADAQMRVTRLVLRLLVSCSIGHDSLEEAFIYLDGALEALGVEGPRTHPN